MRPTATTAAVETRIGSILMAVDRTATRCCQAGAIRPPRGDPAAGRMGSSSGRCRWRKSSDRPDSAPGSGSPSKINRPVASTPDCGRATAAVRCRAALRPAVLSARTPGVFIPKHAAALAPVHCMPWTAVCRVRSMHKSACAHFRLTADRRGHDDLLPFLNRRKTAGRLILLAILFIQQIFPTLRLDFLAAPGHQGGGRQGQVALGR